MISLALTLVLLAAITTTSQASVVPLNQTSLAEGTLGVVRPTPTRCLNYGEVGRFIQIEVTGCITQPCQMTPGNSVEISPSFAPNYNENSLAMEVVLYTNQGRRNMAYFPVSGNFNAGREYRIFYEVLIPTALRGASGFFEINLDGVNGRHIHRCFDVIFAL